MKCCQSLTLSFPDHSDQAEPMELYVDASSIGAGACLMQSQEGHSRPIAYSSVAFSPAEQRYSTIERELLAIRWGGTYFISLYMGEAYNITIQAKNVNLPVIISSL